MGSPSYEKGFNTLVLHHGIIEPENKITLK